jgi:hypothetical protein
LAADFRRILVDGGAMVHLLDCSDYFAMRDKSISRCNFLRYEDWVWRLRSVNFYHNRLRHSDYAAVLQRHGFKISFEWRESREKEQVEVAAMPFALRFVGQNVEDWLRSVHTLSQLRPPRTRSSQKKVTGENFVLRAASPHAPRHARRMT